MRRKRSGKIVVLALFMTPVMVILTALAVDIGQLFVVEAELQRAADSSALAAAWDFIDEDALTGDSSIDTLRSNAISTATEFCASNNVLRTSPNLAVNDIEIGYIADPIAPNAQIDTTSTRPPNAIHVTVRRTNDLNGVIPFNFARMFGTRGTTRSAEATAVLINDFGGFQAPSNGSNLSLLPIACDLPSWNDLIDGIGSDNWKWDETTQQVVLGPDGIAEMNFYPMGNGSPGNRGMVDIGGSDNSTADIARQIIHGISAADLEYHGGKLAFDEYGELPLNADTGISAGIKDELASIIGAPRFIPIFSSLSGNGNTATYTIVAFSGIRIMHVKLTGKMKSKRVIIQPANVVTSGGIPAGDQGSDSKKTEYIYSSVWLSQ